MLRKWIRKENVYRDDWKQGQRRGTKGRQAQLPELELALRDKFIELREKGIKVKRAWFLVHARKLFEDLYHDNPLVADFKFSKGWFIRFKKRHHIAYRTPTNKAQQIPDEHVTAIQKFHLSLRKIGLESLTFHQIPSDIGSSELPVLGVFRLCDIANIDQTSCAFEFLEGKTYHIQGEKTIWVKSTGSGLDKRQMTVQLTIFADGIGRVKPLIVFRGKGLRITATEKALWSNKVDVVFQENACMDENIFLWWMENAWKLCRSSIFDKSPKLLTLDMYKGQNTEVVQNAWQKYRTTPVVIPAGCTSLIQPLDVSVNKSFKQYLEDASQDHYLNNTESWVEGKVSAKERRILMTKWVADAWEKICQNHQASIQRSFAKCGIALPYDGSRDSEIHIEGIPDYHVPDMSTLASESGSADCEQQGDFDEDSSSDVESLSAEFAQSEGQGSGEYIMDI